MDTFLHDLRYACRTLGRQRGFAITAIVTLALGIGATTAIFSVVNAVVLRPLPFGDPDRIVAVANLWTRTGLRSSTVSAPDFHDWHEQSTSFKALAYYTGGETSVASGSAADYATVIRVTEGFFDALGVSAAAGRLFSANEEHAGGPLVAVITDAFWRRQFAGDRRALGSTVKFGERVYTIIGVLPPGVQFPARTDIYFPAWIIPETTSRSAHNYQVVGRLKAGVALEQAQQEMSAIGQRLQAQYPPSNAEKAVLVVPLQETIVGDTRLTLYVLFGAVSLVLLIACANVANLLLARATSRSREMVVRAAVGAGRTRLVRQLLTESAVLAVLSGAGGLLLAGWGVRALIRLAPADLPRIDEVHVDAAALAFVLLVSLAASVIFGLAPALQLSRVQLADGLRQGGKGSSLGARGGWLRHAFVLSEIALAVMLVTGAALLGKSLAALAAVDLGFAADRLVVLRTAVPVSGMANAPRATAFYRDIMPDVRGTPGVIAAGAVTGLPTGVRSNGGYWVEGAPGPEQLGVRSPQAIFTVITPDYLHTLKVPFVRGRDFADRDQLGAPRVAIINEALERAAYPGQDPIGRTIRCGLDSLEPMTIVGVVRDVKTWGPTRPAQAEIYMPYEQHPGPATALNIVARTDAADPLALGSTLARLIRERNPEVPVKIDTMEGTLATASATPKFRTFLLVAFSAVAFVLAVAGVYGVMAYTVSRRIPELGLRMALGATPRGMLGLVMREGARLTAGGLVLGVVLSLGASRLLSGLLFGVTPRDPVVLTGVTAVVAIAALCACLIPGLRALRVDPMAALRAE